MFVTSNAINGANIVLFLHFFNFLVHFFNFYNAWLICNMSEVG